MRSSPSCFLDNATQAFTTLVRGLSRSESMKASMVDEEGIRSTERKTEMVPFSLLSPQMHVFLSGIICVGCSDIIWRSSHGIDFSVRLFSISLDVEGVGIGWRSRHRYYEYLPVEDIVQ